MPETTVALLHPGEMGAAIAACLISRGSRVVWASEGRGAATRRRAEAARIEDLRSLAHALGTAQIALSVCPPHAALELARQVAQTGFRGLFVDANAVSPETARETAGVVEAGGAVFIDGGIIGPPPGPRRNTRLYLCGPRAAEFAALFEGTHLAARVLDGPIGSASALKVCYAAWSKGATALLAGIRTLARREGVDAALLEEWKLSQPDLPQRSEAILPNARKAWRWIAEMEEIAASFAAAGLPDGFHLAAADVYRKLERFKDAAAPPSLDEVAAALRDARGRNPR